MAIPPVNTSLRVCSKCGERESGPGRVLCAGCKAEIEQAMHAQGRTVVQAACNTPASQPVPPAPADKPGSLF